jgi:hypothetical protein
MRTSTRALVCLLLASPALFVPLSAQQAVPVTDPAAQASTLLQQSLSAQTGGVPIADLTLGGTISFPHSVQTGSYPITLTALANGTSQMVTNLPQGTVTHVWSNDGTPSLSVTGASGAAQIQPTGQSTLMPAAAWFSPLIATALASGPAYTVTDAGSVKKNGLALHHLVATPVASTQTQIDIYIDPATSLPAVFVFQVNPYHAPGPTISATPHAVVVPEEIRFSSYQAMQGGMVPSHIQAYLGQVGMEIMDITLSSALLNAGATITTSTATTN